VSGGLPILVEGTDERMYGMEIDIEQAREDLRKLSGKDEGRKLDDMLGSLGLGGVADQLKDLRLGARVMGQVCAGGGGRQGSERPVGGTVLRPGLAACLQESCWTPRHPGSTRRWP
jgi:hypothetical protein